jgi:biotin carboxylase
MSDGHIVLLNSGKVDAYEHLVKFAAGRAVHVITERKYRSLYSEGAPLVFVANIADATEVLLAAKELNKQEEITAIISPSERSLPVGGYLRSYFDLPGPGYDVSWSFANKYVVKRRLKSNGIPTAKFALATNVDRIEAVSDYIGWPVVVKPVIGSGSMNTFILKNHDDCRMLLGSPVSKGIRDSQYEIIVEEYVEMEGEYHCDAIIQNGHVDMCVLQEYCSPLLGRTSDWSGSTTISGDDPRSMLAEAVYCKVIAALHLDNGVTHMELFMRDGQFLVGEISCRPAGGGIPKSIFIKYGVDLWDAFTATALREQFQVNLQERFQQSIANIDLPVQTGVLKSISSVEDIASIDGFICADICGPGTVFSASLNSSSAAGIVYVRVRNEIETLEKIQKISEIFTATYDME